MKKLSKLFAVLLVALTIFYNPEVNAAPKPQLTDFYPNPNTWKQKGTYAFVSGTSTFTTTYSFKPNREVCEQRQTLGGPCTRANTIKGGTATFTHCSIEDLSSCVENVSVKREKSDDWSRGIVRIASIPKSEGLESANFEEIPQLKMPPGRTAFLVSFPGYRHEGGDLFLISVSISSESYSSGDYTFVAGIDAVKYKPEIVEKKFFSGWEIFDYYNIPQDLTFRLEIKLGLAKEHMNTWFSGRLRDPGIEMKGEVLSVEAKAMPHTYAATPTIVFAERPMTDEFWSIFLQDWVKGLKNGTDSYGFMLDGSTSQQFRNFEALGDLLQSKADISSWYVSTYKAGSGTTPEYERCRTTDYLGVVTSSANIYQVTPPTFTEEFGLSYRLAAPHFSANGEVFLGSIEFLLNKNFAGCLWNLDLSKAVQAELSVTYGTSGEEILSTSSLNMSESFIKVSAHNLTFSSPTVSLKLIGAKNSSSTTSSTKSKDDLQAYPEAQEETVAENPKKQLVKKQETLCVRGKQIKKLPSPKSKCPKGYTKKSPT